MVAGWEFRSFTSCLLFEAFPLLSFPAYLYYDRDNCPHFDMKHPHQMDGLEKTNIISCKDIFYRFITQTNTGDCVWLGIVILGISQFD